MDLKPSAYLVVLLQAKDLLIHGKVSSELNLKVVVGYLLKETGFRKLLQLLITGDCYFGFVQMKVCHKVNEILFSGYCYLILPSFPVGRNWYTMKLY